VDQWFNILAGTELVRRVEGGEAFALVAPLIMTAAGEKMGKTAAGAVWLAADRTSPYEYYQFWINTADADVARFLALFTFLPLEEVRRLGELQGAELRAAKEVLALEATKLTHGEAAAREAQATSQALFGGDGDVEGAPTTTVDQARLERGIELIDLLVETGLAPSKRRARDLIQQGGVSVNAERVTAADRVVNQRDLDDGAILLRVGKKQFHRIALLSS
jgi:tyrosyl-tRNA synthetase